MKIRNKLTYQFAFIVASLLFIFSFAIYFFSSEFRKKEFINRLSKKGLTAARIITQVKEFDSKLLRLFHKNNLNAYSNETITLYTLEGKVFYHSEDSPVPPLSAQLADEIKKQKEFPFIRGEDEAVGLLYTDEKNNPYIIIVSAYDTIGLAELKYLRLILFIGYSISVGVIFFIGWIFSGQALYPITKIINEVKRINAFNLNKRVNEGNRKDEISLLAITFNQMLQRIEEAFEMQRNFVSNASHELRTPLSTMRAQLEIATFNKKENINSDHIFESLLEDINYIINLSNGLLDLAYVASGLSHKLTLIRIDELLYQAVTESSHKYPEQKIDLNFPDDANEENLIIEGNETLLKIAFINIIDNACKYSNKNPISIKLEISEGDILIYVIDFGYGISKEDMLHVFQPFYRGNNIRNITGHGIGLPLAQQIIKIHKGTIIIESVFGKKTQVFIRFYKE